MQRSGSWADRERVRKVLAVSLQLLAAFWIGVWHDFGQVEHSLVETRRDVSAKDNETEDTALCRACHSKNLTGHVCQQWQEEFWSWSCKINVFDQIKQTDSHPAWRRTGILVLTKILCCWLKTWTAAASGGVHDPGGWSSSAVTQTTVLPPRGLGAWESHLTHAERKRNQINLRSNKSNLVQLADTPEGFVRMLN